MLYLSRTSTLRLGGMDLGGMTLNGLSKASQHAQDFQAQLCLACFREL